MYEFGSKAFRVVASSGSTLLLTRRLATKSMDAYISGEFSATRNVVPFNVVTTSAVWPSSTCLMVITKAMMRFEMNTVTTYLQDGAASKKGLM